MSKLTADFATPQFNKTPAKPADVPTGRLLITDTDEIIYANTQARHFLGFLADESLPNGQRFLPLVRASYQCFPSLAWLCWPKQPSANLPRYLVYTPPNKAGHMLLKVEVTEQFFMEGREIWVVTINLVASKTAAAVPHRTV